MKNKKKKEKNFTWLFFVQLEEFYLMAPLYVFVEEVPLQKSSYNTV